MSRSSMIDAVFAIGFATEKAFRQILVVGIGVGFGAGVGITLGSNYMYSKYYLKKGEKAKKLMNFVDIKNDKEKEKAIEKK